MSSQVIDRDAVQEFAPDRPRPILAGRRRLRLNRRLGLAALAHDRLFGLRFLIRWVPHCNLRNSPDRDQAVGWRSLYHDRYPMDSAGSFSMVKLRREKR